MRVGVSETWLSALSPHETMDPSAARRSSGRWDWRGSWVGRGGRVHRGPSRPAFADGHRGPGRRRRRRVDAPARPPGVRGGYAPHLPSKDAINQRAKDSMCARAGANCTNEDVARLEAAVAHEAVSEGREPRVGGIGGEARRRSVERRRWAGASHSGPRSNRSSECRPNPDPTYSRSRAVNCR